MDPAPRQRPPGRYAIPGIAQRRNLFSAWIEKLFDDPLDAEPSWPALHEVVRDPSRNFLVTERATGGSSSLTVRADSRQALINGVRHWLSYPVRQAEGDLAISRVDVTRTLAPALRPEAVSGLDPVTTVVLDAGHGGHDGGALSPFGDEKDFALDVVGREPTSFRSRARVNRRLAA